MTSLDTWTPASQTQSPELAGNGKIMETWYRNLGLQEGEISFLLPYSPWFNLTDETLQSQEVLLAGKIAQQYYSGILRKHRAVPYLFHLLAVLSFVDLTYRFEQDQLNNQSLDDPYLSHFEWTLTRMLALTHDIIEHAREAHEGYGQEELAA